MGLLEKFTKGFITKSTISREKKTVLDNFFSLSLLEVSNSVLPLITLPYLVRILGPEKYGLICFAQSFMVFFNILTDYGFSLSATREITIHRADRHRISEIFIAVMIAKMLLLTGSFLIMCLVVWCIPKFQINWPLYLSSFGVVVGQALFPVWFFQGMERMRYITFLNILAKLVFTIAVFIFVKTGHDYLYVPILSSAGFLLAGVLGIWMVFDNFKIQLIFPGFDIVKYHLKEGWHIFISMVSINLYTTNNSFVLGLFTNNTFVGYYSAAEKIIRGIRQMIMPITKAVYPYSCNLASQSKGRALHFTRKMLVVVGGMSFVVSLIVCIFANVIVSIVLGNKYQESGIVLRILAFLPFILVLSNIFGIQTMLAFNLKKVFSSIIVSAGAINLLILLALTYKYNYIGTAISALTSELLVMSLMLGYLLKKRLI